MEPILIAHTQPLVLERLTKAVAPSEVVAVADGNGLPAVIARHTYRALIVEHPLGSMSTVDLVKWIRGKGVSAPIFAIADGLAEDERLELWDRLGHRTVVAGSVDSFLVDARRLGREAAEAGGQPPPATGATGERELPRDARFALDETAWKRWEPLALPHQLIRALDGTRTVAELAGALRLREDEVKAWLRRIDDAGCLDRVIDIEAVAVEADDPEPAIGDPRPVDVPPAGVPEPSVTGARGALAPKVAASDPPPAATTRPERTSPKDAGGMLRAASESLENDDAGAAVALLLEAAKLEPLNLDVLASLGWATFLAGKRSPEAAGRAKEIVRSALERDADHVRSHVTLGHISRIGNERDEARACFQRALELDRLCAEAVEGIRILDLLDDKGERTTVKKKHAPPAKRGKKPAAPSPEPPPRTTGGFLRRIFGKDGA